MIHFINAVIISVLLLFYSPAHAKPYPHKVLRVLDGDTIEIEANFLPDELGKKLKIRILGVDTPEKGKLAKCEKENDLSLKARDYVHKKIADAKEILIDIKKWDKYGGRVLGYVTVDGQDLSKLLIENNYAVAYFGEKKVKDWCK